MPLLLKHYPTLKQGVKNNTNFTDKTLRFFNLSLKKRSVYKHSIPNLSISMGGLHL